MQHIDEDAAVSATSSSTIVEGFLVNKTVRRQSMPEYLGLIGGATRTDEARDTGAALRSVPSRQPVRVSVTLSDYLSTDFTPSPDDPNSDFGWYTPTASGGSIEDLFPGDDVHGPPSPAHGPYLFDNLGCAANTSSNSSSSIPDRPSSRYATVRDGKGLDTPVFSRDAMGALPPKGPLENTTADEPAARTPTTYPPHAKEIVVHHHLHRKHHSHPVAPTHSGGSLSVNRVVGHVGAGIRGVSLNHPLHLPRKRANRMAEINQWHRLHGEVSCSGRMAEGGEGSNAITMHIKRPSFPISTRHFPEKAPALRVSQMTRLGGGSRAGPHQGGTATGRPSSVVPGRAGGVVMAATTAAFRFNNLEEQRPLRKIKPGSYAWALTEIRVVRGSAPWEPARAEYLVVACLGRERLVAGWRRASDFKRLAQMARRAWMSKACVAWESLERARRMDGSGPCDLPFVLRPRRLDPIYLQNKARFLEEFLKQFVFELNAIDALVNFLDPRLPYTVEI